MLSLLKRLVKLLVFGNIWVSFAAVCLYWETVLLHNLQYSVRLSVGIFGATLFIYNYHRLFRKHAIYTEESSKRHQWILAHSNLLTGLALAGVGISLLAFLPFMNESLVLKLLPLSIIALFYVLPVVKQNGIWLRPRDLPYLKVFLVSAVWAGITVFLPFLIEDAEWTPGASNWLTLIHRFVFIFAITLPFDIRDIQQDRKALVKTFASGLGIDGVKQLSRALLILVAFAGFAGYFMNWYSGGEGLGLVASAAGTGWLISGVDEQSDEWFYVGLLDGTMVDQLFWVWFLGLIS
jgi:4-hydroxybenzoate polyprenyltransferase